jgi:hypothetical protein
MPGTPPRKVSPPGENTSLILIVTKNVIFFVDASQICEWNPTRHETKNKNCSSTSLYSGGFLRVFHCRDRGDSNRSIQWCCAVGWIGSHFYGRDSFQRYRATH